MTNEQIIDRERGRPVWEYSEEIGRLLNLLRGDFAQRLEAFAADVDTVQKSIVVPHSEHSILNPAFAQGLAFGEKNVYSNVLKYLQQLINEVKSE